MSANERELLELRRRVARLKEEARKNEEAWNRSQAREMELLEAESLASLLERATSGLRAAYLLESVTLVLADQDHEIRHLLKSQGESADDFPAVRFADRLGEVLPEAAERERPWLGPFDSAVHARLFPAGTSLGSVALLPLARHQRVFGCLNLGSADRLRFTPRHAVDFLHHLAVIAAFALENAINRARLLRSGFTDVLTGWHNRRYLQARLQEELARSRRTGSALACLMIDADHFKAVNDCHGHLAGDEVLRELAGRIRAEVRSSDVSARYGGEEFVVLMPGVDACAGRTIAERIREAVSARPFELGANGKRLVVTVSIGVAEHHPSAGEEDPAAAGERLLAQADRALYQAKAQGRNRVAVEAKC